MFKRRSVGALVAVCLLMAQTTAVFGHRPLWGEGDTTIIPDLRTSFAVYRDLAPGAQADVYAFEANAGERLHAGISVPAVRGLEAYGVSLALLGPGLPPADQLELPASHPEGLGALAFPSVAGEDFFEPFTQTIYWGRQRVEIDLPEAGTYYLLIWQPEGVAGKYVLDTGTAEVFGPEDVLRFPGWWVRVHLFFGHGPYLAAAGAGLLSLVAVATVGLQTKRRRAARAMAEARLRPARRNAAAD